MSNPIAPIRAAVPRGVMAYVTLVPRSQASSCVLIHSAAAPSGYG